MKVHLIADSVLELTQEQPGYWKGVTQIGGQRFHVEAVAVVEAEGFNTAVNETWKHWVADFEDMCHGSLTTIRIADQDCILVITPFGE